MTRPRVKNTIGPIKHTEGAIEAVDKRENWTDINPRHRHRLWSPWTIRDTNAKQGADTAYVNQPRIHPRDTTTLTETEKQWKLRDKCLKIATYYRVMAMQARSKRRIHLGLSRTLFQNGPHLSLIQQRSEQKRCEAHKLQSDSQRQTREGHASAQTHMHLRRPGLYMWPHIEQRQNKKAKIAHPPVGRKRKRLPTLVDTHPNPLLPPLLFSIVENSGSAGVCWAPGPHSLSPLSFFLSYLILDVVCDVIIVTGSLSCEHTKNTLYLSAEVPAVLPA